MSPKTSAMCPKTAPMGQINEGTSDTPWYPRHSCTSPEPCLGPPPPGSHTHSPRVRSHTQVSSPPRKADRFPYLLGTPRLTKIKQLSDCNLFQSVPSIVIQVPNSILEVNFVCFKKKKKSTLRGNSVAGSSPR